MADNSYEYAGNEDVRRALQQPDANVQRCFVCSLYEGQQVPTAQGMEVVALVQSTMVSFDGNTVSGLVCTTCVKLFGDVVQASADETPAALGGSDLPEMKF